MTRILTDSEIGALLREIKPLPPNWSTRLRLRSKSSVSFDQRDFPIELPSGHKFNLILRRSRLMPLDFSVILVFSDDDGMEYILRRHNGPHPSKHTNQWEKILGVPGFQLDPCFHIHMATERYQQAGLRIDGYAQPTERYGDFHGALRVMFEDGAFSIPADSSQQLQLREA